MNKILSRSILGLLCLSSISSSVVFAAGSMAAKNAAVADRKREREAQEAQQAQQAPVQQAPVQQVPVLQLSAADLEADMVNDMISLGVERNNQCTAFLTQLRNTIEACFLGTFVATNTKKPNTFEKVSKLHDEAPDRNHLTQTGEGFRTALADIKLSSYKLVTLLPGAEQLEKTLEQKYMSLSRPSRREINAAVADNNFKIFCDAMKAMPSIKKFFTLNAELNIPGDDTLFTQVDGQDNKANKAKASLLTTAIKKAFQVDEPLFEDLSTVYPLVGGAHLLRLQRKLESGLSENPTE